MFKNVASQKVTFFAFNSTTNAPVTGDAANITPYVSKDDGAVTAMTDTSATELDSTNAKGYYIVDVSQSESNADKLLFSAKSSTANVVVIAVPAVIYTTPASFTSFVTPTGAAVNVTQFGGSNITSASGIPEVKVQSIANNAITTASINDGAITNAKVADDVDVNVKTMTAGVITSAVVATGAIDADALAADAVGEILDEVVEGTITVRQAIRLLLATAVGKASGLDTATAVYRDTGDTVDRVTATTTADGNRTAVTLNVT